MNVLVFDIETIPDTASGRKILDLNELSDEDVAKALFTRQVQKTGGSDFLPLYLHKVVAISVVLRRADSLQVWSLGDESSSEGDLITRFYDGLAKYSPTLVSWNGAGFDLPVLHYRSMLNKVNASRYWDAGDDDREMKFNNYLNRFHWRHIDLMDVLSGFNLRGAAPLNEMAVMLGYPGKLGMSGAAVWDTWQAGKIKAIRDYCETDVLNTYLVYLHWELVRGNLMPESYQMEIDRAKDFLESSGLDHFAEFLSAWNATEEN